MADLNPAQRTAGTARILLTAGTAVALEAIWRGSAARALIASLLMVIGASLLFLAKRAS